MRGLFKHTSKNSLCPSLLPVPLFSGREGRRVEAAKSRVFRGAQKIKSGFNSRTSTLQFGIFCFIDDVKVDFVRHLHALIRPTQEVDGIKMFSTQDIVAMKVQAILGRGRKKDFWAIAELLNHFSVADFIQFHQKKCSTQNLMITGPQAITYFADDEESYDP